MNNKPKAKTDLNTNRLNSESESKFGSSVVYNNLVGEGEKFFREGLYEKAVKSYTKALELYPENKTALAERAYAYFKLGEYDLALLDADKSLKDNKEYIKALYIKAETLYAKGEFELALVFYHRCKKLRQDGKEFQIGINKAQEAIENCVGDPESVKLDLNGDLAVFTKQEQIEQTKVNSANQAKKSKLNKKQLEVKREKRISKADKPKTVKQLLGELYADKVFLEKILDDDLKLHEQKEQLAKQHSSNQLSFKNTKKENQINPIIILANDGLEYLDSRTEFWRQQKPLHRQKVKQPVKKPDPSKTVLNYILKNLEAIEILFANEKYLETVDKSKKLLDYVEKLPIHKIADKDRDDLLSKINSNVGNAFFELNKYDPAIRAHQKDLDFSLKNENNEGISRAYENLGRVYARMGKYKEAVQVWEKKIPLAESDQEKAWLFHEIGHCCLELKKLEEAKDYGLKSLDSAVKIDDQTWILNANILIAQAELKMGGIENLKSAIVYFEKALELTEEQNDMKAGSAVKKALEDCKNRLKKLEDAEKETETETEDERDKQTEKDEYYDGDDKAKENLPEISEEDKNLPKEEEQIPVPEKAEEPEPAKIEEPAKVEEPKKPEPEAIIKTEPQIPTEPIKQTEKSESDNPIKKTENVDAIINYDIEVATSKDIGSGTDAAVAISIYGSKGEILNHHLSTSLNNKDPFERAQTDKFTIRNKSIGNITKINIGHDARGLASEWKLDFVKITYKNEANVTETKQFMANCLLDTKKSRMDILPS